MKRTNKKLVLTLQTIRQLVLRDVRGGQVDGTSVPVLSGGGKCDRGGNGANETI